MLQSGKVNKGHLERVQSEARGGREERRDEGQARDFNLLYQLVPHEENQQKLLN